ncbi:hypothetical protein DNTS_014232 [Danionella cerebrum]|uniref:Large ribosomal subunit protein mL52 n=1 Tax=Danionella cerebrum TaxID=2873325 RepID=A0A553MWC7_9TELE|nr:hypothetical protein DNTS_014232 [Danionella translucida]
MAASLRTVWFAVRRQTVRPFSSTCVTQAGRKWRLENGLALSGSEYGPMTDLPDWSFTDGRPTPPMKGQVRRQKEREEFARRTVNLNAEMDTGMRKWHESLEAKKHNHELLKASTLKPKGELLKNKK